MELIQQLSAHEMIGKAWLELMPGREFNKDLTWSEAGVDSLKSLEFLLRLEQLSGQKVPFDLFARGVKLGDVESALERPSIDGASSTDEQRRRLFLFPGIFGDEPILANFRRAIEQEVVCEILEVADLEQPSTVLGDIGATSAILARQIIARQPTGPIALAGYSFGGFIAYQVALDLQAQGRTVDLLCLLDALTASGEAAAKRQEIGEDAGPGATAGFFVPKRKESALAYAERMAFRFCQYAGLLEVARRIVLFSWRHYGFVKAQQRRKDLVLALRMRALRSWRPSPCSAPTLLIASDDCVAHGCEQVWRSVCTNFTLQHVGGDHHGIFDLGPLGLLKPALLKALDLAPVSARPSLARTGAV